MVLFLFLLSATVLKAESCQLTEASLRDAYQKEWDIKEVGELKTIHFQVRSYKGLILAAKDSCSANAFCNYSFYVKNKDNCFAQLLSVTGKILANKNNDWENISIQSPTLAVDGNQQKLTYYRFHADSFEYRSTPK